jgi:hypothetical protein
MGASSSSSLTGGDGFISVCDLVLTADNGSLFLIVADGFISVIICANDGTLVHIIMCVVCALVTTLTMGGRSLVLIVADANDGASSTLLLVSSAASW